MQGSPIAVAKAPDDLDRRPGRRRSRNLFTSGSIPLITIGALLGLGGRVAEAAPVPSPVIQVRAQISPAGFGVVRCEPGAKVLGGGYLAGPTGAGGQLPRILRAAPGHDARGRQFFAVLLVSPDGQPWRSGGEVFASCLSRDASATTQVDSRTVPIPASGFGVATCPAGDEATGGGYTINYPVGGTAAPLATSADPGTAEDGTSTYQVELFSPGGQAFTGGGAVTVRCLPRTGRFTVGTASTEFATGADRATAACPAGSHVVGGGYISAYHQGPPNRPVAVENRPQTAATADGYAVTLIGEDRTPLPLGGFAVGRCLS